MNPSVDICYHLDELKEGVNRCSNYGKTAGGKGINVSKVLKDLGCEVMALGLLGGDTGNFIERELKKISIHTHFTKIEEATRNCIAILNHEKQIEILESGPYIKDEESKKFIYEFSNLIKSKDINVLVASGSIPNGLEKNYYNKLIDMANKENIRFVVDTSGQALKEVIKGSPYLIKPNIDELQNLLDIKIQSEKELIKAMYRLKDYNIKMIVVSLGKDGCMAMYKGQIYKVSIPEVIGKNPVGSGDAMVAGMVKEIDKNSSYEEILRVGSTCGILNFINEKTGAIQICQFKNYYDKIKIQIIK